MGNYCCRSRKREPIFEGRDGQPISKTQIQDEIRQSVEEVDPPSKVNADPQFIANKEIQYKTCLELINKEVQEPFNDRAFGCIIGAFIGDSCGSYIEFDEQLPSKAKMESCMKMPGGGYFTLAPGQITDDGEMIMALMTAYIKTNENVASGEEKQFDFTQVSKQYARWYMTQPFDMGQATETSVKSLIFANRTAEDAMERANTFNAYSRTSDSIKRSMPHAIFGANMAKEGKFKELKDLVAGEVKFVHSNKIVQEAVFVYVAAIAHLINNPDDINRSVAAFEMAQKLSRDQLASSIDTEKMESVSEWLKEAKELSEKTKDDISVVKNHYDAISQMSEMKHAFILSFYCLLMHAKIGEKLIFKDAIQEIISLAGESATNACIVGGMLGALLGFKALDEQMVKLVLSCDVTGEGHNRPDFLSVGRTGVNNIKQLIELRAGDSYKVLNKPSDYLFQESR